jgi:hypothetical protein
MPSATDGGRCLVLPANTWLAKNSAVVFGRLVSAAKQAPGSPESVRLSVKIGTGM